MIKLYRFSHWLYLRRIPFIPTAIKILLRVVYSVVLPPSAKLGKNVLLSYGGLGTVIHKNTVIGDNVVIATGVTIGGRSGSKSVPIIENGAFIGTGAKILGSVRIGQYASIGANAVVLNDIPDYAVAVGIPAKVVKINNPEDIPNYFSFRESND